MYSDVTVSSDRYFVQVVCPYSGDILHETKVTVISQKEPIEDHISKRIRDIVNVSHEQFPHDVYRKLLQGHYVVDFRPLRGTK